jgi:hypothetical protein
MTNSVFKTFASAAVVVLSVFSSAGCRSAAPEKTAPAGWPEELRNFSIVWTGEQGIDLVAGPAVPVRAYIESFLLGELTGDEKYLYPGFADAVEEKWGPGGSAAPEPWVGTATNHLLSLERSGSDVTAIGCMYTYNAASPHGDDEYEAQAVPPGAPEAGIIAFKVTLSAPSQSSGPGEPQKGPARTPFDDVFGGYKVTGYFGGYFSAKGADSIWSEYQQATADCIAKAPDPLERRKYLSSNYVSRSEFPTLPAAPGWPAKPAS